MAKYELTNQAKRELESIVLEELRELMRAVRENLTNQMDMATSTAGMVRANTIRNMIDFSDAHKDLLDKMTEKEFRAAGVEVKETVPVVEKPAENENTVSVASPTITVATSPGIEDNLRVAAENAEKLAKALTEKAESLITEAKRTVEPKPTKPVDVEWNSG